MVTAVGMNKMDRIEKYILYHLNLDTFENEIICWDNRHKPDCPGQSRLKDTVHRDNRSY